MRVRLSQGQRVLPAEVIDACVTAFEQSWSLIKVAFAGRTQADIARARDVLADAIANAALGGHIELSDLKQEGIQAVRLVFTDTPI
jgi:hypothetical protein